MLCSNGSTAAVKVRPRILRKSLDGRSRLWKKSYMKKRSTKSRTMSETLRQAIADSELPFLQLEQQTGVLRQTLMKFARNKSSLRLDMADKLAEFFELELQPAPKPKRKKS